MTQEYTPRAGDLVIDTATAALILITRPESDCVIGQDTATGVFFMYPGPEDTSVWTSRLVLVSRPPEERQA